MWKKIFTVSGLILVLIAMSVGGVFGRTFSEIVYQSLSFNDTSTTQLSPKNKTHTQKIEDLTIHYASPFLLNEAESKDIISSLPLPLQNKIRTLSVYSSEPSCGIGEIRIVKVAYLSDTELDIDSTATGAIKQLSSLEGIADLEKSISSLIVSGYHARKVSFKANRWGGVLGGEFLFIADTTSKTIWQLQLLFSTKSSNHEKLNDARSCANEVLKNISINHPTTDYGTLIDEMSQRCELVFDGQTHEECCTEKSIKNCPSSKTSPVVEKENLLTKEGIYALLATAIITLVIYLAFRKYWIQKFFTRFSEATKAIFTGWVIWIFIVISYVTLFSPYEYIDYSELLNITLWCFLPPSIVLTIYFWVKRFFKFKK